MILAVPFSVIPSIARVRGNWSGKIVIDATEATGPEPALASSKKKGALGEILFLLANATCRAISRTWSVTTSSTTCFGDLAMCTSVFWYGNSVVYGGFGRAPAICSRHELTLFSRPYAVSLCSRKCRRLKY